MDSNLNCIVKAQIMIIHARTTASVLSADFDNICDIDKGDYITSLPIIINGFADVGMVVREVRWMGRWLFQGTGRCGISMVDDLCLFSKFLYLCHPYIPLKIHGIFLFTCYIYTW